MLRVTESMIAGAKAAHSHTEGLIEPSLLTAIRRPPRLAKRRRPRPFCWVLVPVHLSIGGTEFTTALFPRDGRYLVPIKVAAQGRGPSRRAVVDAALRLNVTRRQ